ncbi:galactitol-1-phosphate 5-dehydrogenase [soil metagenome]|jgi:threonine dehydrogenase-like Zn-dependent dehydrogenase
MKGIVWNGPEEMSVEEMPEPTAEPGMVVIHTGAAGICGSEVEGYLGKMGNRTPPLVMGHEFAGTVSSVGEGVDESWEGRRATVNPLLSCGECRLCRVGLKNLCENRTMIGIHHPGGFAEYVQVPESALSEIPDDLDISAAALAEPLANGVHAVRLGTNCLPAERAVVVGGGTIGIMVLQSALLSGIQSVSVVELHEGRREQAKELGAHEVFASGDEAGEAVRDATEGLGADLVLDAVGAEATRQLAVDLVKPGGMVMLVGLHGDETTLGFHNVVRGQVTLQGSYAYTPEDFEQALAWISSGQAGIGELPTVLPLERGPDAFAHLVEGPQDQIKVFLAGTEG